MKKLYNYAVLLHTYETTEKNGKVWKESKMIIEPKNLLAKDEKEVLFKVTREIDEKYTSNPEDVEILVRNF